jgi:hypothetical protein
MNLEYKKGELNFIIQLFEPLTEMSSGGYIALHRLAYKLAERGNDVQIFCEPGYPHPNIKVINSTVTYTNGGLMQNYTWEGFHYPLKNTISIYPQTSWYNSFNTEHVVRWILYDTQQEIESTYGENDVYFNYLNFNTFKLVPYRKMTVLDYRLDSMYVTNTGKRKSFCHIIHKNTPPGGEKIFDDLKSFNLTDWRTKGDYDYLREMFNQYEYFLTYDQKTYFSVMATLCGCKTIILNPGTPYEWATNANIENNGQNEITPTEFRLNNYLQQFGIAYGWDDLQWAKDTISLSRDYIGQLEIIDNKNIDNFINYWKNKIYNI